MLVLALLLVLARTVVAEVYFYPNESTAAICNETTLTCVTTDTGELKWSTPEGGKTFIDPFELNTVINLGEHITVQLTGKAGLNLTSVATITGYTSSLNGTVISCADREDTSRSIIKSKILLIHVPVLSELGFKALNFTSATLSWVSNCIDNYTILVQEGNTSTIVYNMNTLATSLNVTGLTRGEEYTVTVSTEYSKETVMMTLEVPETVTDLMINQLMNSGINVSWKQPQSSRPPVLSYIIQHNITDNGSNLTEWTNITIHGALPGHVYYIQVTPVNVLGPGTQSVRKTILTVTQSLPTSTSVSETTATPEMMANDLSQLWMLLTIIMVILCVVLLVVSGAAVISCCCAIKRAVYYRKLKYDCFEGPPKLDRAVQLHLNAIEDYSGGGGEEGEGEGGQMETSTEKTGPSIYDQPVNSGKDNIPMEGNISYAIGAI